MKMTLPLCKEYQIWGPLHFVAIILFCLVPLWIIKLLFSVRQFFFHFYFHLLDIDDCMNHTCTVSGGSCVDGVNNYSCLCLVGFTGDHCETS